jgi:hypothetical protein
MKICEEGATRALGGMFHLALLSIPILALGPRPASAGTIVISTIPAASTCCGEAIGNPPNASLQEAIRFVPNGDYFLDSVTFDLVQSFGSGLIVAQIYSEQGGLPGTLLDSLTAAGLAPAGGGLFTIGANSSFLLQSGVAYWLTGIDTDPSSGAYWWYSDQEGWRAAVDLPGKPAPGFPTWGNANGGGPAGPGTNQSLVLAFEIDGTPVPEPATSGLVGLTAVALLGRRRYARQ